MYFTTIKNEKKNVTDGLGSEFQRIVMLSIEDASQEGSIPLLMVGRERW